jgi:hypothetical protein
MLKTFLLNRPYAAFDVNNADHRRAYRIFLEKKSWTSCPYQFVLEEPALDLLSNINHQLVDYYTRNEFKPKVLQKKPRKSPKKVIL